MGIGVAKAGGKEVVGGAIGPGIGGAKAVGKGVIGGPGEGAAIPGVLHRKTKVDLR